MGYLTTLSGELQIEPPLSWTEMKGNRYLEFEGPDGFSVLRIRVREDEIETEHGILSRRSGVAIEPFGSDTKAYNIKDNLREIIAAFPAHRFVGCIEGEGETQGDVWRLYVRSGNIIEHKGVVSWPDEPPWPDAGDDPKED